MKRLLQLQICYLLQLFLLSWGNIQAQTPDSSPPTNKDAPTLHAIIYGVTNDVSVSNGVELSLKHIDALLNKVQQYGGM
ncbi:MAG: hypothetical protein ACPGXL_10035, partial [Chitinophagales bacterium]